MQVTVRIMLKKIMFTLLTLLCIYSAAAVIYKYYEPQIHVQPTDSQSYIEYDSLSDYILSSADGTVHYLYFYDSRNADCIYVKNTIFTAVEKETRVSLADLIEIVSLSNLDQDTILRKLHDEWNVNSYPSFICISVNDRQASVDSILEWESDRMITSYEIEVWLTENGIDMGISDSMETVPTPEPDE